MRKCIQKFNVSILETFTEKTFLTILFLIFSQQMFAQLSDNFSDGDFTNVPQWRGDDAKFTIDNYQLRLQAPVLADVASFTTPSQSINDATWQFNVRLAFNPSSSNYARVYLTSNQPNLADTLTGYFVMIGNTADEISLYKQSGSIRTKIIDGTDGRISTTNVEVKIKVTRDAYGNWELFSDSGLTGSYTLEGTVSDITHLTSNYFGVFCHYTSTRSDKFYFDDIVVTGTPYVPPAAPLLKDVIITEIFADPSPRVELPEVEFIELFNRSTNTYNLAGWKFTDGSSIATLPAYTLLPHTYVIVTAATVEAEFLPYGNVVGVGNFPSLNNAGDALSLKFSNNLTIDSIKYDDALYAHDEKKQGGWSLELIDTENTCAEETNWTASEDESGGTPGQQNSIFANKPDVVGCKLQSAIAIDETHLVIHYNEKLFAELPSIESFKIHPELQVEKVAFMDRGLRAILLTLSAPLEKKERYTVESNTIQDCAGNIILNEFNKTEFGLPETADSLDVVINEVLFNPRATGVDFVEVVNRSDKFINIKDWMFSNVDDAVTTNLKIITDHDFLLPPGAYLVFTENANILLGEYPQTKAENVMEVLALPTLNDDEGSLAIVNAQGKVIDHFTYAKSYHSIFVKDEEGVSLERISFDSPTMDSQNWKSASSVSGFATPGFINSNATSHLINEDAIQLSPEVFIPVNGQPNFTEIRYKLEEGGAIANVKILDASGHLIKQVANNVVLGSDGFLRWDGDRDDGTKARVGYYLVWFEIYNAQGSVQTFRKRLAIAAKF